MSLYIDGTRVANRTVRGGPINAAPGTAFQLGGTSDPGLLTYSGVLDEPTVFGRALTETEVAAIHAAGSNGKCAQTPPNTQVGKFFDMAGADDGDWFEDGYSFFTNRGSAYVFVRDGTGTWTQQAKLEPSTSTNVQNFGRAVGISGDTVVVGSLNDDNLDALDSGAVYVFTRDGTAWSQQAQVTSSDRQPGDGLDLAVEGDTVVAGADLGDDDARGELDSGAVYVFTRSVGVWTEAAKLTAADAVALDEFGSSVAIRADVALVGAYRDDGAGLTDRGSVYVFGTE